MNAKGEQCKTTVTGQITSELSMILTGKVLVSGLRKRITKVTRASKAELLLHNARGECGWTLRVGSLLAISKSPANRTAAATEGDSIAQVSGPRNDRNAGQIAHPNKRIKGERIFLAPRSVCELRCCSKLTKWSTVTERVAIYKATLP